jgi:hypothetical protein
MSQTLASPLFLSAECVSSRESGVEGLVEVKTGAAARGSEQVEAWLEVTKILPKLTQPAK